MKKAFFYLYLFCNVVFFGCSGSKKFENTKDLSYVPFTNNLKQRILNNNLDLKKVQFFVDQKLVLRRSLGKQKADIKSGVILFENGEYIQEVIIPKYTPGVCESVNGDDLMISFELQNNNLEFGPGHSNQNFYMLYAKSWLNGSGELTYDNQNYKVTCGSCYNASEAKLVVKKTQADKLEKSQRVIKGRKVDN